MVLEEYTRYNPISKHCQKYPSMPVCKIRSQYLEKMRGKLFTSDAALADLAALDVSLSPLLKQELQKKIEVDSVRKKEREWLLRRPNGKGDKQGKSDGGDANMDHMCREARRMQDPIMVPRCKSLGYLKETHVEVRARERWMKHEKAKVRSEAAVEGLPDEYADPHEIVEDTNKSKGESFAMNLTELIRATELRGTGGNTAVTAVTAATAAAAITAAAGLVMPSRKRGHRRSAVVPLSTPPSTPPNATGKKPDEWDIFDQMSAALLEQMPEPSDSDSDSKQGDAD
eukprot:gene12828-15160_t